MLFLFLATLQIRLENKIPINNGILCLSAKNVRLIGGTVQSLYEEWQMNQKYSGLSRPSLRLSQSDDGAGPPPFEKLDTEARPYKTTKVQAYPGNCSYPLLFSLMLFTKELEVMEICLLSVKYSSSNKVFYSQFRL